MKTITNINPIAAAAAFQVQAKDDVRFYLNGIFIEPREAGGVTITATNGHAIISAIDTEGHTDKPIIVDLPSTVITKCKQKAAERLEIIEVADGEHLARVTGCNHTGSCNLIDGKYPDWRIFLPAKLPKASAEMPTFQASVIDPLIRAARILYNQSGVVRIHSTGALNVAYVQMEVTDTALSARAAMMPLRRTALEWTA